MQTIFKNFDKFSIAPEAVIKLRKLVFLEYKPFFDGLNKIYDNIYSVALIARNQNQMLKFRTGFPLHRILYLIFLIFFESRFEELKFSDDVREPDFALKKNKNTKN